jgi:hypothetical protein
LAYLRAIGIDPATAIKRIVATHWHDDHYKGFSKILYAAPAAHVWIATALTDKEFVQFSSRIGKNRSTVAGNKLSEFSKTFAEILRRNEATLLTFGFASANSSIYRLSASETGHGFPCEILALSPSHGDVLNFMRRIAAGMPGSRQTKRAVPSPEPNEVSIATMIFIGTATSILLGADVENSGGPTAGWEAIVGAHRLSALAPRASVYKIPHHGSENAHNADVWRELMTPNPLAALTPWRKGGAVSLLEME